MRAHIIVQIHDMRNPFLRLLQIRKQRQRINPFRLQCAVHPLCQTIVRRVVILAHADAYMVVVQQRGIGITRILYPAVGMVRRPAQIAAARCEGFSSLR